MAVGCLLWERVEAETRVSIGERAVMGVDGGIQGSGLY